MSVKVQDRDVDRVRNKMSLVFFFVYLTKLCGHLWPPCVADADIIFLPCGYFFFFSSPNLSRRRLDVCHTSTHDVALVQIKDAGLKRAAGDLLKIQDPKNRQKSPSRHHLTTWSSHIFAIKAHIDNRKKLVKQQYLLHMSSQYGKLRPTSG